MLSWIIGKTVSGVSTSSNLSGSELSSATIMFDDGTEVSFSENWLDSAGWSGVTITENQEKLEA